MNPAYRDEQPSTRPHRERQSSMTLAVYRIRPDGTRVLVRDEVRVAGGPDAAAGSLLPDISPGFPPCRCPRCRDGAGDDRG